MFVYLWATLPEINILYLISYILYLILLRKSCIVRLRMFEVVAHCNVDNLRQQLR